MAGEATPALHYSEEDLEAFAPAGERWPTQAALAHQLLETIRAIRHAVRIQEAHWEKPLPQADRAVCQATLAHLRGVLPPHVGSEG